MVSPPIPHNEAMRLHSLYCLRVLDTASEERFDRITRIAKRALDVDICLISLVDEKRQWFKSRQGLDADQTSRCVSFSGHAILEKDVFIVEDATIDARFTDNPLVTGGPDIRFYAGCPIKGPFGYAIGTLCVIDRKPRSLSQDDCDTLRDLAAMVESELRARALHSPTA